MKATTIYLFFAIFLILATSPVTSDTDTTDFEIAYTAWYVPSDGVKENADVSPYDFADVIDKCAFEYFYSNVSGTRVRRFELPNGIDNVLVWGYGTDKAGYLVDKRLPLLTFFNETSCVNYWYDLESNCMAAGKPNQREYDPTYTFDGKLDLVDYWPYEYAGDFGLRKFDSTKGEWLNIDSELINSFSKFCEEHSLYIDFLGSYDDKYMLAVYICVAESQNNVRCGSPIICIYDSSLDIFDDFFSVEGDYDMGSSDNAFYMRDIPCDTFEEALNTLVTCETKPYWPVNGFNGEGWGYSYLYVDLIRPADKDHLLVLYIRFGLQNDDVSYVSTYTVSFGDGNEKGNNLSFKLKNLTGREGESVEIYFSRLLDPTSVLNHRSKDVYLVSAEQYEKRRILCKLTPSNELYLIDYCLTNPLSPCFTISKSGYIWYVSGKTDFVKSVAPESALHNEAFLIRYDPETETRLLILNPSESADPCVAITNLCPRVG